MTVNSSNNSGWEENLDNNTGKAPEARPNGDLLSMLSILGETSLSAGNRNVAEILLVKEALNKKYEDRKKNNINPTASKSSPMIDDIDPNVSPVLPGLVLYMQAGKDIYIAPFLFHNNNIILDHEDVSYNLGQQNLRQSTPRTPASYINVSLIKGLQARFKERFGQEIEIHNIGGEVINLNSYVDVINDTPQLVKRVTEALDNSWETSFKSELLKAAAIANMKLPAIAHGKKLFGVSGTADARVNAVVSRMGSNGVMMPSNMEIQIATTNPNNGGYNSYNQNNVENTPREVCRTYANVSLTPYNYQDHLAMIRATNGHIRFNDGMTQDGFKPFRPTIALNAAVAGPQLNSNAGIIPLVMGLFSMMVSNNNYAFSEVIRRTKCGVRGNLVALETRLDEVCRSFNIPRMLGSNSIKLDDKNINDVDVVNAWIKQHVMQSACFTIPIIPGAGNPALTKFLIDLTRPETKVNAVKAFVAAVDSLSDNGMSTQLRLNDANPDSKGWKTADKIYHTQGTIIIEGTASFSGVPFNLGEIDEMGAVTIIGGGKWTPRVGDFLQTMYAARQNETEKARQQRLRAILLETQNLTDLNITAFGRVGIMDPRLMSLLGNVIAKAGTLNTSGLINSLNNGMTVFAAGTSLATDFIAGSATNGVQAQDFSYYNV